MDDLLAMLTDPLMTRGLIAALLVGLAAPVVGTYLVQRKVSLLGDGIGHVALTGVALGWIVGNALELVPHDALAVPGAILAAVVGSVAIELVRERGRASGDIALAMLFYGGIAGGVLLISLAGGTNANLMGYLFGSIATVSDGDLILVVALSLVVLVVGVGLRHALFAVSNDEEFARASGLPVRVLNITIAVVAALTVTTAMRVVGLLLVSALMIVPVAIAQLVARSFRQTMVLATALGAVLCLTGLSITYWHDLPPGALIIVLAIGLYAVVAAVRPLLVRGRAVDPHPEMPDDLSVPGDAGRGATHGEDEACARPRGGRTAHDSTESGDSLASS